MLLLGRAMSLPCHCNIPQSSFCIAQEAHYGHAKHMARTCERLQAHGNHMALSYNCEHAFLCWPCPCHSLAMSHWAAGASPLKIPKGIWADHRLTMRRQCTCQGLAMRAVRVPCCDVVPCSFSNLWFVPSPRSQRGAYQRQGIK